MKVVKSQEDLLEFDNGLTIEGEGEVDCCANNYIDFEQFEVGAEFPTMTLGEFVDQIKIKEDGFAMKDINNVPKWAQARSYQNGYYSTTTHLTARQGTNSVTLADVNGGPDE